jgi:hypothetical protein
MSSSLVTPILIWQNLVAQISNLVVETFVAQVSNLVYRQRTKIESVGYGLL